MVGQVTSRTTNTFRDCVPVFLCAVRIPCGSENLGSSIFSFSVLPWLCLTFRVRVSRVTITWIQWLQPHINDKGFISRVLTAPTRCYPVLRREDLDRDQRGHGKTSSLSLGHVRVCGLVCVCSSLACVCV